MCATNSDIYCYAEHHDTPCPQPCHACAYECDPDDLGLWDDHRNWEIDPTSNS